MLAQQSTRVGSYSADIRIELLISDRSYRLSHAAPDWFVLSNPASIPAGPAEVLIHIDGEPIRRSVRILPHEDGVVQIPIANLELKPDASR